MNFDKFFKKATGNTPFPFQSKFVEALPQLVCIPTGLGKTAMAVVGWLWRRFGGDEAQKEATPRRLLYCLPMRVLVEQTRDAANEWIKALRDQGLLTEPVPKIHVLMGGEEKDDWDIYPERDAIIIGTQDMLLSRALNRGYAASRARWPMQFGLLNTDCLWIFDEIQLMGSGLATTAQLEAFRRILPHANADTATNGHGCCSVWMSATLDEKWLETVDFRDLLKAMPDEARLNFDFKHEIEAEGLDPKATRMLEARWTASKPLAKAKAAMGDVKALATEIVTAHKTGTRTIAVVNTVMRASGLYKEIAKKWGSANTQRLVLLHSRFRPGDREKRVGEALAPPPPEGTIAISTQVIEAGVDVSATALFTELAPWASLVQRFGRCNRKGEENEHASVYWIPLPLKDVDGEKVVAPYDLDDLKASTRELLNLTDVGLRSLPNINLPFKHIHVIRRRDVVDLFDATPDLAGNDIDIDRYVREVEDSDVRVFWRDYGETPNETDDSGAEPAPRREELCPAPIGEFKKFAAGTKQRGKVWRWDFLDKKWEKTDTYKIAPGQVYLVHADAGGYTPENGWSSGEKRTVRPPQMGDWKPSESASVTDQWSEFAQAIRKRSVDLDDYDDDGLSRTDNFRKIADHTDDVCRALTCILDADSMPIWGDERRMLDHAARWHDLGKAHHVFQNAVDDGQVVETKRGRVMRKDRPDDWKGCREVAKAPGKRKDAEGKVVDPGFWRRYDWLPQEGRKHFRHELASALAVLQRPHAALADLGDNELNLIAHLIAAHHGKVRLSIRSFPNERRPPVIDGIARRFACGVWDSDELPKTNLGGGIIAPAVTLSLELMELGLCEREPFAGQASWAERMIRLRDRLAPFRLAYLEALLRAADMRASKATEKQQTENHGTVPEEAEHG